MRGGEAGPVGTARGITLRDDDRGRSVEKAQVVGTDLVSHDITPHREGSLRSGSRAHEGIEDRVSAEAEHPGEPPRNLFGEGRLVPVLAGASHLPVTGKPGLPFLTREHGELLLFTRRGTRLSRFLEEEDILEVYLDHAIGRVRIGAHDYRAAGGVHRGLFPPDDGTHGVEPCLRALADDLRVQGNHPVASEHTGAGELVADIHAQPAPGAQ